MKLFVYTVEFIILSNGDKLKHDEINKPSSGATTGLWVCLLIPFKCPAVIQRECSRTFTVIEKPPSCSLEANNANDWRRHNALFTSQEARGGGGSTCVNLKLMFRE